MATKLKKLLIDRVDLVDRGANPDAHIVLFKRDGEGGDAVEDTKRQAEDRSLLKAAWDLIAKHLGIAEDTKKPSLGEMTIDLNVRTQGGDAEMASQTKTLDELLKGVADEVRDAVNSAVAYRDKEIEELRKRVEELSKKTDAENKADDINKADLPEPVRKRLEELEKQAQEAERIAKAEREARVKAEIRKRVEGYANVGEVDKIAEVIYKAQGVSAEFAEELETLFKAAHERIAKGDLFKEIGSSRTLEISSDPSAQFAELVEKAASEGNLSYTEAARKVAKEHPEIAKAYEASVPVGQN